jgi:hypothetical protein
MLNQILVLLTTQHTSTRDSYLNVQDFVVEEGSVDSMVLMRPDDTIDAIYGGSLVNIPEEDKGPTFFWSEDPYRQRERLLPSRRIYPNVKRAGCQSTQLLT